MFGIPDNFKQKRIENAEDCKMVKKSNLKEEFRKNLRIVVSDFNSNKDSNESLEKENKHKDSCDNNNKDDHDKDAPKPPIKQTDVLSNETNQNNNNNDLNHNNNNNNNNVSIKETTTENKTSSFVQKRENNLNKNKENLAKKNDFTEYMTEQESIFKIYNLKKSNFDFKIFET